jgi:hypothetical protein
MGIVAIEWYGAYPEKLTGRHWGLCAGSLAGLLGGAIGTPGPPVILYAAAQSWSPRVMKAMLQAFFLVNQFVILANHWWAGLLTREVAWLACLYAVPSAIGVTVGIRLFDRINQVRFRRLMFALLFILGLAMCVRG